MSPGFIGNPFRQEPVDLEPLKSIVANYDVQVTQGGFVDGKPFWDQFNTGGYRGDVEELMEAGLADKFNFVYDEEFETAPVDLEERVGKPEPTGSRPFRSTRPTFPTRW